MNNYSTNQEFSPVPDHCPEENALSYRARMLVSVAAREVPSADFDAETMRLLQTQADPSHGRPDRVDWSEKDPAPGIAGLLHVKRVGNPAVGSPEYVGSVKLVGDVHLAKRRAEKATTVEDRLRIVGKIAKSVAARLDGRHSGLALVEGDVNDPLYLLAVLAGKVREAVTYRNTGYQYGAAEAFENLSQIPKSEVSFDDSTDPRVEAVLAFVDLVRVVGQPTDPVIVSGETA